MGNPTSFDDRLQSDLMAIELTNQLHPEKINGGNISLNYTFDVRPDSKEPEVKTPLQEKSSAIYGDTLPMTIVEPYLRMSARALASVSTLPVQPVAAPTSLPAPAPLATPDTVASTPPTVDQGVSAARQEQVPQEATAAPTSHEAVQSTAPPVPPPLVKEQARGSSLALRHPNHPPATQKQRKLNPGALKVIAASARIHWATGQSDP